MGIYDSKMVILKLNFEKQELFKICGTVLCIIKCMLESKKNSARDIN